MRIKKKRQTLYTVKILWGANAQKALDLIVIKKRRNFLVQKLQQKWTVKKLYQKVVSSRLNARGNLFLERKDE